MNTYRIYIEPYNPKASIIIASLTNMQSHGDKSGDGGVITCTCEPDVLEHVLQALRTPNVVFSLETVHLLDA